MREVFQQELREVQDRLVEIAELVAFSIEMATSSAISTSRSCTSRSSCSVSYTHLTLPTKA